MKNRLLFLLTFALMAIGARGQSLSITVDGKPVSNGETVTSTSYYEDIWEDYYSIQLAPKVELTSSVSQNVTVKLTLISGTDPFNGIQLCWPSNCQMCKIGDSIVSSNYVEAGVYQNLMIDSFWADIVRNTPVQMESRIKAYATDNEEDCIEFTLLMCYPDLGGSDYIGSTVIDDMSFSVFKNPENGSLWATLDALTADFSAKELVVPSTVAYNSENTYGSVEVPLVKINDYAASGRGIVSVVVPSSVNEIGNGAFSNCTSLNNVRFDDALSEVAIEGNGVFQNSPLKKLYLGRNIGCDELTSDYSALLSLTFAGSFDNPSFLKFADCKNLMQIISYSEAPQAIGKLANDMYSKVYVYVPFQYETVYSNNEHWAFFSNIIAFDGSLDDYDISLTEANVTVDIHNILQNPCYVTPEIKAHIVSTLDNSGILGYDPSGNVYANLVGECDVTYTLLLNGKTATCHVTVVQPATGIIINKQSLSLEKGETVKLFASVDPADVTDATVTWSSTNDGVASVASDGTVTAVGGGSCEIIATTYNGLEAKCHVAVTEMPESIAFDKTTADIDKGEEFSLTVTFAPESSTERTLTWSSSDSSVASVNEGVVKGIKGGTTVVTATTINGLQVSCEVRVIQHPLTIEITPAQVEILLGESISLTANVGPADVTDATVTWSSTNEAVATVDNEGTVTAVGGGSCEIVATTHNGLEAKCQVTVTEMPESITLDKTAADINKGEEITLAVIFTPESATERALTWTSSAASVASVSDGVVKGLKAGTAVITATTVNGKSAECTVTVHQPAETIVLDVTKTELEIGETLQLTAAVGPEDTEDKTVTWSSSDEEIATVSGDGLVTAVEPGEAVITATTVNGLTAECEIAVNAILVKRIELNRTAVEAEEGEQFQLTATVYPENATDKTLSWSSSDETVATVDGSGMVTVKSTGSARITAASTDGSDVKAECELTAVAGIDAIFADGTLWSVYTPDGLLIKADCGLDDLRQLASGLYILRSGTATRKIHLNR